MRTDPVDLSGLAGVEACLCVDPSKDEGEVAWTAEESADLRDWVAVGRGTAGPGESRSRWDAEGRRRYLRWDIPGPFRGTAGVRFSVRPVPGDPEAPGRGPGGAA